MGSAAIRYNIQVAAVTEAYNTYPAMLEFRLRTGNVVAFVYHGLVKASYEPSKGIVLGFLSGPTIQLAGRNLLPLFEGIIQHQVRWVPEIDKQSSLVSVGQEVVIEEISIQKQGG